MPKLDGSGPRGEGAMTGRGRGSCKTTERMSCCGRRQGLGLGLGQNYFATASSLESLELEEKVLQARLDFVLAQKNKLK